jgi:hypothetical protein
MEEIKGKLKCIECGKIFATQELLVAENPFDKNMQIQGCPYCKDVGCFEVVCDEPGCKETASCGFLSKSGIYRRTCHKHMEKA